MQLKNKYFELSSKEQKAFLIKLGVCSFIIIIALGFILFCIHPKLAFGLPLVVGLGLSIIAPFFDVPSFIENGKLKYYSVFLLAEEERKGIMKIHGGTLFDYYFVLSNDANSQRGTRLVLLEYLKGLVNLINQVDENIILEGTSYIINERTSGKIGFEKVPTQIIQKIILYFNYLNLMASMYFVKKTIHFPNLNNVHTFRAKVSEIKKNEAFMNQLISKLESTTT